MTKADMMKMLNSSSVHTLYDTLLDKVDKSTIVKIYTTNGECIKVKGDKYIYIADITPDYISIKFDSHLTDLMFSAIERIEYLGGEYSGYDYIKKIKRK